MEPASNTPHRDPRDLLRGSTTVLVGPAVVALATPQPISFTLEDVFYVIAGGYSYASLSVGLVLRNPQGRETFIQPGDDEASVRAQIAVLGRLSPRRRAWIADAVFGELFS